jgi:predicted ArsR family transcriptional regulator
MTNRIQSGSDSGRTATVDAKVGKGRSRHITAGAAAATANASKKDQLIALLSKPNGARVSVIAERLQWQAHTVRAALSGLRKQGFGITTSRAAKTGETVYAITEQPAGRDNVAKAASA